MFILFLSILFLGKVKAQKPNFDEKAFFENLKTSYYTLADEDVSNFIALVTSLKMQNFAKEMWQNQEVFPLQLIWFAPDVLYISQRGVPKIKKGKYQEYQNLIEGLKIQVKGILLDLQRFYLGGLYRSISGNYVLKHNEKAIQITYTTQNKNVLTQIKYLFGYNGLCILNQIAYPQQNKIIIIYPKFKTVKNKWLCEGWKVQTYINDQVESGFNLDLTNRLVNDKWVPVKIALQVQKAEEKGKTFYDEILIKNYLFDQSIQLQGAPTISH